MGTNLTVSIDDELLKRARMRALRAASRAGCASMLTEALGHGEVLDGVRIDDPFR